MEKSKFLEAPQKGYKYKDGIHFVFPFIVAEKKTYQKLRDEIIADDFTGYFEDNDFVKPSNSIEEIVDNAIYKMVIGLSMVQVNQMKLDMN